VKNTRKKEQIFSKLFLRKKKQKNSRRRRVNFNLISNLNVYFRSLAMEPKERANALELKALMDVIHTLLY
jgi:hypothetical protein